MSNGVNLSSGQLDMVAPGVGSGGLGMVTAFSARYNNIAAASTNAGQGYGWQTPYVPTAKTSGWSGADVMFQNTSGNMEYMKAGTAAGTYDALFGNRNTLSKNTTTNELTLKAADGTVTVFNSLTASTNPGLMQSQTSAGGVVKTMTGSFGANQSMDTIQSYTASGTTYEESFLQAFDANGALSMLTRRKRINSGSWENIEQVQYNYFDGTTSFGSAGDLRVCTKRTWIASAAAFGAPKVTMYRKRTVNRILCGSVL